MGLILSAVACVFAAALVFGALFAAVIVAASESGEVVLLHTRSGERDHRSRLWIVDHDGSQWLRSGSAQKRWFREIEASPRCELQRGGRMETYNAVPVRDASVAAEVNRAFTDKYGDADWIVALSGRAANRVVVRLDPAE